MLTFKTIQCAHYPSLFWLVQSILHWVEGSLDQHLATGRALLSNVQLSDFQVVVFLYKNRMQTLHIVMQLGQWLLLQKKQQDFLFHSYFTYYSMTRREKICAVVCFGGDQKHFLKHTEAHRQLLCRMSPLTAAHCLPFYNTFIMHTCTVPFPQELHDSYNTLLCQTGTFLVPNDHNCVKRSDDSSLCNQA